MGESARIGIERQAARMAEPAIQREDQRGLMALQRMAGNRAVAGLIAPAIVQRHPEPTTNAEVGETAVAEAPTGTTEPVTGTTSTSAGALTGDARKKAIEDTLRASNTGTWALGIIEKWKIPVDYEYTGTGSFHSSGRIYLNKSLAVGGAALVMMHEAQHADTFKSGNAADINALGRAEYVKKKIADEAEAVVRQIEGMAVTSSLGVDMTGAGISEAHKKRYLTAFNAKAEALRKADPKMSTADVNAIARTHARDTEVTNMFHDGTFVTSTGLITYSDHYGNQWDKVHNPPAKT